MSLVCNLLGFSSERDFCKRYFPQRFDKDWNPLNIQSYKNFKPENLSQKFLSSERGQLKHIISQDHFRLSATELKSNPEQIKSHPQKKTYFRFVIIRRI